ncbi:hypothetical protein [Nocardia sp. NPDC046763]
MPHIAVTLMVIFGFLGCALVLRVLAAAEGTRESVRKHSRASAHHAR